MTCRGHPDAGVQGAVVDDPVRTLRIMHIVIPVNAGISGAALVVRSRVGARDDVQVRIPMWARKEPIQENLSARKRRPAVNSLFVGIVGAGVVADADPHTGAESPQRHHRD